MGKVIRMIVYCNARKLNLHITDYVEKVINFVDNVREKFIDRYVVLIFKLMIMSV